MNTNRYPRTLREAFGHHTGTRFVEEAPRVERAVYWIVLVALLFVAGMAVSQ